MKSKITNYQKIDISNIANTIGIMQLLDAKVFENVCTEQISFKFSEKERKCLMHVYSAKLI